MCISWAGAGATAFRTWAPVVGDSADEHLDRAAVDDWRLEATDAADFREVAGADHLVSGAAWLDLAGCVRDALT